MRGRRYQRRGQPSGSLFQGRGASSLPPPPQGDRFVTSSGDASEKPTPALQRHYPDASSRRRSTVEPTGTPLASAPIRKSTFKESIQKKVSSSWATRLLDWLNGCFRRLLDR